ncbi:MAG: SRPBCC domain-containing protein [Phycisphaerae bacterium]
MINLARLSVSTPTDTQIVMSRAFNAARRLVWDAMTKPELIRRWLYCPDGWEMTRCDEDVRVGGRYNWEWNGPDGKLALAIRGEYREVSPPDRVVRTEVMEMPGMPQPGEMVSTMELIEKHGVTTMRLTMVFPSKQTRDAALASGMERGMEAGYAKLDAFLAERAGGR